MTIEEFKVMLDKPFVVDGIPNDFDSQIEAKYLFDLISTSGALQKYKFDSFISAGGSGMVFKVKRNQEDTFFTALKIVRKKIFDNPTQSSFSEEELDALKELVHANILRQYEFVEKSGDGIIAICSALISNPQGLDRYVQSILDKTPKAEGRYSQISPERLNDACETIISWFYQIALALQYMHEQGYYHLDIKPANILLHRQGNIDIPIITDMGSCIRKNSQKTKRAHFTWAYAHPELTDMASKPGSVEGGGLRASADISDYNKLAIYDLYALGKTIQQILAVVEDHFGEMSFSNYFFRYMHIISALLLDGKNGINIQKERENISKRHNIKFVTDFPMQIREKVFTEKKISSATDLVERIKRHKKDYSITALAEEFDARPPHIINNTVGDLVPFSNRVSKIFNHPTVKRLYGEPQLGLMTEIYPGASHNRWSHSVGVYSIVLKYYIAILSDPENPLVRIIINKSDINHALIAAILHDIGQTSLCHDLEAANNDLFDHISYFNKLIRERSFSCSSSSTAIVDMDLKSWGDVDFKRVFSIIKGDSDDPIDCVASDAINGPIDADKLDYIKRDSYYCGVSYGDGIDYNRILNSLTVCEIDNKIRLAYYAKGRTAISSMLLARYQLYGSVYWHHTYRCLHAMLFYAAQLAFGWGGSRELKLMLNKKESIDITKLRELYYYRVICKLPWSECWKKIGIDSKFLAKEFKEESTLFFSDNTLDFLYRFTNATGKYLLTCISERNIFKRIYSKSLNDVDVSLLIQKCENRIQISKEIQSKLFSAIKAEQMSSSRSETSAEIMVTSELKNFESTLDERLYIVVDFPKKVTIPKNNWPNEVGDSSRKLQNYGSESSHEILNASNSLLSEVACLRVYSEPDFFSVITRYLHPKTIESCVKNVITVL